MEKNIYNKRYGKVEDDERWRFIKDFIYQEKNGIVNIPEPLVIDKEINGVLSSSEVDKVVKVPVPEVKEVVKMANKFRQNILFEEIPKKTSVNIKDHVTLNQVIEIIGICK